ncbi:MAG TPA: DUF167 domain-containing protein [Polyangiaceae bacterium]|jgi:hypothetical protein
MSAEAVRLVTTRDGGVRFEVQAKPRARTSRVAAVRQGALVVQLAAPPVDGAANAELVRTLAEALAVPRRDVLLVRGEASRAKLVEIRGLVADEVRARLGGALGDAC